MTMISVADTKNSLRFGGFKAFQDQIEAPYGEIDITFRQRSGGGMCSPVKTYRHKIIIERGNMSKELNWTDENLDYTVDYGTYVQDKRFKKEHYRRSTIWGNDGIIRLNTRLFHKWPGMCETQYIQGRLITQKFIYPNGIVAYAIKPTTKEMKILHPNGKLVMIFEPVQRIPRPRNYGSPLPHLFSEISDCFIEEWNGAGMLLQRGRKVKGKKDDLWYAARRIGRGYERCEGKYDFDGNRTGIWKINDVEYFYYRGTAIPKELWEKPKEELDLKEVLKIDNAQARSLLLEKAEATPEKIASLGELIHQTTQMMRHRKKIIKKKMRLYSVTVPNNDPMKFLQVECPSTDTKYYLRIPPTATKCHEALQWTYGRGQIFRKQLKFVEET